MSPAPSVLPPYAERHRLLARSRVVRSVRAVRAVRIAAGLALASLAVFGTACGVELSGLGEDAPTPPAPNSSTVEVDASTADACATCDAGKKSADAQPFPAEADTGVEPPPDANPPPPDTGPPPVTCSRSSDCDLQYCLAGLCAQPPSCRALHELDPSLPSAIYKVAPRPGEPLLRVYCDMASDGGGWLLAAKIHRHHQGYASYDEQHDWWSKTSDVASLLDGYQYEDRLPGVASLGRDLIGGVAENAEVARFTLVAEENVAQRATWFKEVKPDVWSWFASTNNQAASLVCLDANLTTGCTQGRIAHRYGECLDATCLEGMSLTAFGHPAVPNTPAYPQFIHMRLKGDADEAMSGVCSDTFSDPTWSDSDNVHWGNGLMIWLR